jgi:MFS family permease
MGRYVGDKVGYINIIIISCLLASGSALILWTLASDFQTLASFSCIYGATSGVFVTLAPSVTRIVEKKKFESAYALFLILTMISTFGPNLAALIEQFAQTKDYFAYKAFTGLAYLVGTLILMGLKSKLSDGHIFSRL